MWKTEEEVLTKSDYLEIIANREASFEATKKDIEAGLGDGLTMEECLKDHEESIESCWRCRCGGSRALRL